MSVSARAIKRYIDRRVDAELYCMKVRHLDGIISSLFAKAKTYFVDLKRKFSRVSWVRKILFILGKLIELAGIATLGLNAHEFYKMKKDVDYYTGKLKQGIADVATQFNMEYDKGVVNEKADSIGMQAYIDLVKKNIPIVISNLVTAIFGYLASKLALEA